VCFIRSCWNSCGSWRVPPRENSLQPAPEMALLRKFQKRRKSAMKVALYARYSSDSQRDASIADQLRACRGYAERQGWQIVEEYTDHAVSGASLLRPGIQALITDAGQGRFQAVLAEAMDRLSRDQEDIAGLFKRMAFGSVKIMTLSEGEVSQLHVGLKGTMNALFLKDLADKTRRGLVGRVKDGKSGGGLCFGYDVVRQIDAEGDPKRGERTINEFEASIVRRIFRSYNEGKSSRTIALELNREGVPGPQGGTWGPSTIHGNPTRGTGIINNELYVGRLVWNRLRYLKDPATGRRVSRLNPEMEWVTQDVPELRVVDQEVWDAARERQRSLALASPGAEGNRLNARRRPRHLFSGLVRCGSCGGGFSMISKDRLGCSAARDKATCQNRLTIRRDALERAVLDGLRSHLMEPELFAAFCEEFTREVNRLRIERDAEVLGHRRELERIDRELEKAIQAILDGVPGVMLKDKIGALEDRKIELAGLVEQAAEPIPLLHPNLASLYRARIAQLCESLNDEEGMPRAAEVLRTLIDQIRLVPSAGKLVIDLRGDLAAILTFASDKKRPDVLSDAGLLGDLLSPVSLVAGTGFEPVTFRL
jgi:site-specific DNA recombinase